MSLYSFYICHPPEKNVSDLRIYRQKNVCYYCAFGC